MNKKGATDAGGSKCRLFLSYGWKDDQPFVKGLYDDLYDRGYDPWMDVHNMPSRGRTLPQEVIDNLSACERVIAVIGLSQLHEELLSAYRKKCQDGWPTGFNDGYFFQYLPYHLKSAKHDEELRSSLLNPERLERKLDATDVSLLVADFDPRFPFPA